MSDSQNFVVRNYHFVLLALATAMLSRILVGMGAPAALNFLHFVFVAAVFGLLYPKVRSHLLGFFVGMWVLLGVIVVSALINGAGAINVVLDYLLLIEPFLLLLAIVGMRWSHSSTRCFSFWLLLFAVINVALAFFQRFVLGLNTDDVKGLYLDMGAGAHVAGAVALSAALYFLVCFPLRSMWLRATFVISSSAIVILTDAKQVMVVFLLSLLVLMVIKWKHIGAILRNLVVLVAVAGITVWTANTVFPALRVWSTDEVRAGLEQKLSVFSIVTSYYHSPLSWLVGLGPGHTVGRLGQLLPDYLEYLQPVGATMSPVTGAALGAQQTNWASNSETGSSMWSLFFSWAGVWGDLGLLGIGTYLLLWLLVWRKFCLDDVSRFLLVNILIFGAVFGWMEEPGYVLFIIALIGLRWQEHLQKRRGGTGRKHLKGILLKPRVLKQPKPRVLPKSSLARRQEV